MSRKAEPVSGKKRKYHDRGGGGRASNPKRGGPGVLLTCETGRERKCEAEGLDILRYYCGQERDSHVKEDGPTLSLEEELKILKSGCRKEENFPAFGVYNTGIRGTVFVVSTKEHYNLIPPIQTERKREKTRVDAPQEKNGEKAVGGLDSTNLKKDNQPAHGDDNRNESAKSDLKSLSVDYDSKVEGKGEEIPNSSKNSMERALWDPVEVVRKVIADLHGNSKAAPSSRFVTRMIPVQATCFASTEELQVTTEALIQKFLPDDTKTFAIVAKRRNCGNLNRDKIIQTVAALILTKIPSCKVNLDTPDVAIVVEVCRTLCGIAVVPNYAEFRNFNLAAVRESTSKTDKAITVRAEDGQHTHTTAPEQGSQR